MGFLIFHIVIVCSSTVMHIATACVNTPLTERQIESHSIFRGILLVLASKIDWLSKIDDLPK